MYCVFCDGKYETKLDIYWIYWYKCCSLIHFFLFNCLTIRKIHVYFFFKPSQSFQYSQVGQPPHDFHFRSFASFSKYSCIASNPIFDQRRLSLRFTRHDEPPFHILRHRNTRFTLFVHDLFNLHPRIQYNILWYNPSLSSPIISIFSTPALPHHLFRHPSLFLLWSIRTDRTRPEIVPKIFNLVLLAKLSARSNFSNHHSIFATFFIISQNNLPKNMYICFYFYFLSFRALFKSFLLTLTVF